MISEAAGERVKHKVGGGGGRGGGGGGRGHRQSGEIGTVPAFLVNYGQFGIVERIAMDGIRVSFSNLRPRTYAFRT